MSANTGNQLPWKMIIITVVITIIALNWMKSWLQWGQVQQFLRVLNIYEQSPAQINDMQKTNNNMKVLKEIQQNGSSFGGKEYEELKNKTENVFSGAAHQQ